MLIQRASAFSNLVVVANLDAFSKKVEIEEVNTESLRL